MVLIVAWLHSGMDDWLFDPWDLQWVAAEVVTPVLQWLGPGWARAADLVLTEPDQPEVRQPIVPGTQRRTSQPILRSGRSGPRTGSGNVASSWVEPELSAALWLTGPPELGSILIWCTAMDPQILTWAARHTQLAIAERLHDEACQTRTAWGTPPPTPAQIPSPARPPTCWRPQHVTPTTTPLLRITDGLGTREIPARIQRNCGLAGKDVDEPLFPPARLTLPDIPPPDLLYLTGWDSVQQFWTHPLAATVIGAGNLPTTLASLDLSHANLATLDRHRHPRATRLTLTAAWIGADLTTADWHWNPHCQADAQPSGGRSGP